MPIHTSVYFAEDVTGSASVPSYVQLPAATDDVMGLRSNNLVPGENLDLVALAATGTNLAAARIRTPRTVISPAYARPVNNGALFLSDPNVACFPENPVRVMKGEEIQGSAWVNSAGAEAAVLVAWFQGQREPLPAGESFWVTFSATVSNTTGAGWYTAKNFTFVEQPTLPAGRYAIVGMHLMQAVSPPLDPVQPNQFVCGRLVIPNRVYRPGVLVLPEFSSITPSLQSNGELGVWETFDAKLPPTLELYAVGTGGNPAFAGTVSGYLRIIQIGS